LPSVGPGADPGVQAQAVSPQVTVKSSGALKMQEWKMQEWKLQEKTAGVEIAGVEEAGVDRTGGICRSGKTSSR